MYKRQIPQQQQSIFAVIQGKDQIDRGVGKIMPADICQPVYRVDAADHHRISTRIGQLFVQSGKLVRHALSRYAVGHTKRARSTGLRTGGAPYRINRVVSMRHKRGPGITAGFFETAETGDSDKARVDTDALAGTGSLFQPA